MLLKEGPVICVNDDSDEGVVCVIFRRRCRDAFRRLLEPTLALQRRRRRRWRRPGSEPAAHRRRLWRLRTGTLSGQTEIKVWTLERESYRYFRKIIEAYISGWPRICLNNILNYFWYIRKSVLWHKKIPAQLTFFNFSFLTYFFRKLNPRTNNETFS